MNRDVRGKEMRKLHEQIRSHIENVHVAYQARASKHRKCLKFIIEDMAVLASLKGGNLSPYVKDNFEDALESRTSPLEEGEVDMEQGAIESSHNPNHDQRTNEAKEA